MHFSVLPAQTRPPTNASDEAFLVVDNWDDYHFKTLFRLVYVDSDGKINWIGLVKIARYGMGTEGGYSNLPERFSELPENYFSLGQDDSYYENLSKHGGSVRDTVLQALRDLALDADAFEAAFHENVTHVSLLRGVSKSSVLGQFHRLALGRARLTKFSFTYTPPTQMHHNGPTLSFSVHPESKPPTNIHVLIGRNGVGKTRLLQLMTRALVTDESRSEVGEFRSEESEDFAGLVSVSFSAFDEFDPPPEHPETTTNFRHVYLGLKRSTSTTGEPQPPKNPSELSAEFVQSVVLCRQGARARRWLRALEMLESDPIFSDADVTSLARLDDGEEQYSESDELAGRASQLFSNLSSGHKIVLLTITRLVESVEEKSLVLIDEPEAHLHPPLLSAFVRSLSDLLTDRNGVAIIATHSPVLLQEVPRSCVWKLRRNGLVSNADRPEIETFGENVGVLTREVFGLEVTQSGFHRMLQEAIQEQRNYEDVVNGFDRQLGGEALALLRSLQISPRYQLDES